MVDLLAILPYKTPAFSRKWLQRVFGDLNPGCLFFGHPATEVFLSPNNGGVSIRQNGAEIDLEARSYIYLPASCERQNTVLARVRRGRYADFISREWDAVTQFLEQRLGSKGNWTNSPLRARVAANKLVQLFAAHQYGLTTPATMVTNDAQVATEVLPSAIGRGVCKPICESGDISADWMAPSSFFTAEEVLADSESVSLAPSCFQRSIEPRLELRTYVFGPRALSVAIRPRGKSATADLSCQELEEEDFFVTTDFPKDEAKLIGFVNDLGLRYAAVDSLISEDASYFLEINPNGGWGWLPAELQAPLDHEFRQLVLS